MRLFKFQFKWFVVLNLISMLLILSWSVFDTREYWDNIDQVFFKAANASLVNLNPFWSNFWAILSVRIADLAPLLAIVLFFYFDKALFRREDRVAGFIGFVLLLILMLLVREAMDLYIEYNNLGRPSPTLILESAVRLSEMYPNLNLKDSSSDSFPGDHAAVLFTWFGYCIHFVRNKWSVLALIIVIIFSLPRLIAGAHWFSDVMVGGLSIALISLSIGVYTPLLNNINTRLTNIAHKFVK